MDQREHQAIGGNLLKTIGQTPSIPSNPVASFLRWNKQTDGCIINLVAADNE
jgi:hypothetical protein